MSKKTTETTETQQPAFVEELLKNGTAVLTAKTRDELAEMVNDIPADVRYAAGAVGHNPETGVFTLRVDITNP
jgi:hypothetical protein